MQAWAISSGGDFRVPPPPGHRWIRYPDGRYMLVAIATGIIADILLGH